MKLFFNKCKGIWGYVFKGKRSTGFKTKEAAITALRSDYYKSKVGDRCPTCGKVK